MTLEREIAWYRRMVLIREFEERAYALFREGALQGTTHACIGQEAIPVGVIEHLERDRDLVVSNHRGHGHYLEFTDDVDGLLGEIMGRDAGVCRGWGGSQHLHRGGFYSNGVLGNMAPVSVGLAMAEKTRETGAVVCSFMGDGALGEGVVYESMNMASLWKLPIVFCVENNQYQQATRVDAALAGRIADRGRAFGIEALELDGNDVAGISAAMQDIVAATRSNVPHWVVFNTYRLAGHSKSDDNCYRDPNEEAGWRAKDPIDRIGKLLSEAECQAAQGAAKARVDEAYARVSESPEAHLLSEDFDRESAS